MNPGQVFASQHSFVTIGRFCAIGHNVHIRPRSHDPIKPTGTGWHNSHRKVEAEIVVSDCVWIGDNAFVIPPITVGDHAIARPNCVVTLDVPARVVARGVSARLKHSRAHES